MKIEKKRILFVCVENARRSQMAQGFAEALEKENWRSLVRVLALLLRSIH